MTWQVAARASGSSPSGLFVGGFSWGLALLCTVGFAALVIVCSLGFIARMRDRAADRQDQGARAQGARAQEARERASAAASAVGTDARPSTDA